MNEAWRELVGRYGRLTPRERAFAGSLLALLALVTAQTAFDWATRCAERAARAQSEASEAQALVVSLSDEDYRTRLGLETGKVWRSAFVDTSIAGALAQALLAADALAAQAGLANAEVALVADEEGDGDDGMVHTLRVALSSDFSWEAVAALFDVLAASESAWVLEHIEVLGDPDNNAMRVVLRAPALLETPE